LHLVEVATALGLRAREVEDIGPAVAGAALAGGVHVLVARTDREANVALHERLHEAVGAALDRER
jgi:hypothetical protein